MTKIKVGSKEDFEETIEIFEKKYRLKNFNNLSELEKRHRCIDIILNEHTYDAAAIFHVLINMGEQHEDN